MARKRRFVGLLVTSFAVIGGHSVASAAEPECAAGVAVGADAEAKAKRLYEEGRDARSAGDSERARVAFLKACELNGHYQIVANLGEAEFRVGRYRESAEHLARFLREAPRDAISAAARKNAEVMLSEAKLRLSEEASQAQPTPTMKRPPEAENGDVEPKTPVKGETAVQGPIKEAPPPRAQTHAPSTTARDVVFYGGLTGALVAAGVGVMYGVELLQSPIPVLGPHEDKMKNSQLNNKARLGTTIWVSGGIAGGLVIGAVVGRALLQPSKDGSTPDVGFTVGPGGAGFQVRSSF